MKTKLFIILLFVGAFVWAQEKEEHQVVYHLSSNVSEESLSTEFSSILKRDVITISPVYDIKDVMDIIRKWLESKPKTNYGAQIMNVWYIASYHDKIGVSIVYVDEWYNINMLVFITYTR